MNLFSTIKGYAIAALAFLGTLATLLFAARKAGKDVAEAKHAKKAAEVQSKATDALTSGLTHESTELDAARARRRAHRMRDDSDSH